MSKNKEPDVAHKGWLAGGGEMGALIRAKDWSKTSLGPIESWPQSLKTIVRIMLDSRYAMWMGWGQDLSFLYNDAYRRDTLGKKHPWALGKSARAVWAEIWSDIGPRIDHVLSTGDATWDEGCLLFLERSGYSEETYHTFSYSPLYADAGTMGGMLCVVTEETERVVAERRVACLGDLASSLTATKTEQEVFDAIEHGLTADRRDLPFTFTYLYGEDGEVQLAAKTGIVAGPPATAIEAPSGWPLDDVRSKGMRIILDDLVRRFEWVPPGPWKKSPTQAMLLPIAQQGQTKSVGIFVAGINPHRPLDDAYQGFVNLVVGQIAAAVANARAYEEERKRAEALAELDRAKTAFFSNVSHELRTPLTLMLGPLEDELRERPGDPRLEMAHRNSMRLLKLVNTLLDFSRIEAGRIQASYHPTDLALLTSELASVFRSAIEKAGMRLTVHCPELSEPIYVDRDMYEKIVLNLVSNAFKFTLDGEIEVRLRESGESVELSVRDTGAGIAKEELPRIFERFHRVEGARARTHEGTGIGLALVQELVNLHGGVLTVESEQDHGSTFTVTIPLGHAHLDAEQIGKPSGLTSTGIRSSAFVEEALRWLPEDVRGEALGVRGEEAVDETNSGRISASGSALRLTPDASLTPRPRILVVDDNADMREYVSRLLRGRFEVQAVADGQAALEAARANPPDLVLTDVMMPRLDGFGLLRALRADPATKTIPVILLSARAGEESRVEGLEHGADDYLIKPFSARELLARVQTHLDLARVRREAEQRVTNILESLTDGFHVIDADGRFTHFNRAARRTFTEQGIDADTLIGKHVFEAFPDARELPAARALQRALAERVPTEAENFYTRWGRWIAVRHYPTVDGGVSTFFQDITGRKQVEKALREGEERFRTLSEAVPAMVWICRPDGYLLHLNQRWIDYTGQTEKEYQGYGWAETMHPEDRPRILEQWKRCTDTGELYEGEVRYRRCDGQYRWHYFRGVPLREGGHIIAWYGASLDIQEKKVAENALRESEERFVRFMQHLPGLAWIKDAQGRYVYANDAAQKAFHTPQERLCGKTDEDVFPPEVAAQFRENDQRVLAGGTGLQFVETLEHQDGLLRHSLVSKFPIPRPDGQTTLIGGMAIDITERKRAEEALRRLNDELEQRVAERTQDLMQSQDRLRALASEVNLAEQRERKRLATELHDHLQQMLVLGKLKLGQGKRLADTTPLCAKLITETDEVLSDALRYTRTLVAELSPPALHDHGLAAGLTWLGDDMKKRDMAVTVTVAEGAEIDVPEDRSVLLFQSVRELLINASKHAGTREAWVKLEQRDGQLVIEVKDNGVGFDLAAAADTPNGGLSSKFGLFSIRERMRALGGSFDIQSAPEQGTTATLSLPLGEVRGKGLGVRSGGMEEVKGKGSGVRGGGMEEVKGKRLGVSSSEYASPLTPHPSRVRVLLVDDHAMVRQGLRSVLDSYADIEVVGEAQDGEEAVTATEALHPAVVLMDINMPKMNGIDATAHIKARHPEVIVIGLSVNARGENERAMQQAGAAVLLTKEAAMDELYRAMQEALGSVERKAGGKH